MKKSRFTESQNIGILKEAESGVPVTELCRTHGMSDATFYKLAGQIRRHGCFHDETHERTGRRKPPLKEDVCRRTLKG